MSSDQFVVNVEAAVLKDGKWLMIIRSKAEAHAGGTLSMVGGTTAIDDPTEDTLEATLRRELKEEVDIEVGPKLRYVESKTFLSDTGRWVLDVVFLAHHASGEPRAVNAAEVESVHWLTTDEILRHPATPPWIAQSLVKAASIAGNLA